MMKYTSLFLLILMSSLSQAQLPNIELPDNLNQRNSDGEQVGTWVRYHGGGTLNFLTQFVDGEKQGLRLVISEHGQVRAQELYEGDTLHGYQRYYDAQGRLERELNYNHGVKDGVETEYYVDRGRVRARTSWSNGVKDGVVSWYYPEGVVSATYNYRQGNIDGLVEYFYLDGPRRSVTEYENNQRHGEHQEFYESGQRKVYGMYEEGEQVGLWTYYNEDGTVQRTQQFREIEE